MKQSSDDHTLFVRIKSGDGQAFEKLYNRYWESLFSAAQSRLRSKELSQDVVQELFVELWEKREEIHIRLNIRGYLFTALKNRVINKIKSEAVREKYEKMVIGFYELNDMETERRVSINNFRGEVKKQSSKLPARCREVFELSRMQQLSHEEIGKKLDISPKTVENHIAKALKTIRPGLKHIISVFIIFF